MAETSQRYLGGQESLWNFCHTPILPGIQLFTQKVKCGVRKLLRLIVPQFTSKIVHGFPFTSHQQPTGPNKVFYRNKIYLEPLRAFKEENCIFLPSCTKHSQSQRSNFKSSIIVIFFFCYPLIQSMVELYYTSKPLSIIAHAYVPSSSKQPDAHVNSSYFIIS